MSVMPRRPIRRDGYYDNSGQWQRTKFCFRPCGTACTCSPPNGQHYSAEHDKAKQKGPINPSALGEEVR